MSLYSELKRRNVFRVAITYLALAWLLTEVAGTLFPGFGVPEWAFRFVVIVLVLGFVPALVFSWAYEITPEGIKREKDVVRDESITHITAKRLDGITITLIAAAVIFIVADRFWLAPRYEQQSSRPTEVLTDVGQTSGPELKYPPYSIAVLPFVNMSDDPGNEYFSDGISEELLNLLAKIPELRVIARTSSFAYKGKDVKIADVAKELNVGHVLEGSVRKAGNQVRITAQLIRSSDSSHLWSESFDRSLDNIFMIQDEIAQAVINQLKVTLLGDAPKALEVDPEAYALFLQARHFGNLGTNEGVQQAEQLLQQALEITPNYSAAWSELGRNWQHKASNKLVSVDIGYAKAEEYQNKALELDPSNAVAYSRLGFDCLHHEWDWPAAAELFEKALTFGPGNAVVLANAASMAMALGRMDQAITLRETAIQLDPLNAANTFGLGVTYYFNDQPGLAEASFRKTLSLSPNRPITRAAIVRAMVRKGNYQNTDEIWQLIADEPYEPFRLIAAASMHYKLGNFEDADIALEALIEKYSGQMDPLIALAYAIRGSADEAIGWLQQAIDSIGPQALLNSRHSPEYDFIRSDPRWQELLTKAGLSEEQLAAIDFEFQLP